LFIATCIEKQCTRALNNILAYTSHGIYKGYFSLLSAHLCWAD